MQITFARIVLFVTFLFHFFSSLVNMVVNAEDEQYTCELLKLD
jgi:hypothetical protein